MIYLINLTITKEIKKMYDYLFFDNDAGENFFVECDSLIDAWATVIENFGENHNVNYINVYSWDEAERMGYDTY